MTICRPWVLILAAGFVLTPSYYLMAAVKSGAAFLRIGTGARPTAMGGAYTAVADDVNALYYNPGGLGKLRKREMGFTHAEWLLDTKFDFVGYAHPTQRGTFGLGVTRLSVGSQEGRDADRRASTSFDASDTAYTLSYSRTIGDSPSAQSSRSEGSRNPGMSLGANFKLLPDISRVISRPDTRGDFRSTASWHTGPSPRFERRSYPTMTPG